MYFKDDYEAAAEMVADVQEMYSNLLETMPAEEAGMCTEQHTRRKK